MNRVKTVVLLARLTALLLWAGHALAGQGGLMNRARLEAMAAGTPGFRSAI